MMPPPPAMASIKEAKNTPTQIRRMTQRGKPSTVKEVNGENNASMAGGTVPFYITKFELLYQPAKGKARQRAEGRREEICIRKK